MPGGYSIPRIVESNHALNSESCTVASTDESSLPAENLDSGQLRQHITPELELTLNQPVMYDRNFWYSLGANSETQ
jgi:hypothetical protein